MAYQSFPSAPGDSSSLEKLEALRLPDLRGKSFLDVGCNEGFFCGFAAFAGAARVVGIDQSKKFVDGARRRFPHCEFFEQSWAALPPGRFDVVLLASALHYAESQPELVQRLLAALTPSGTLVLEIGVAGGESEEWVTVKRGPDVREFPTWRGVERLLRGFAWRHVGPSVRQSGDPVGRHVFHVTRRRPHAYLLMLPPAFGKTSLCRDLFAPAGVSVVSGDRVVARIANGAIAASAPFAELVRDGFSPLRIDQLTRAVFEAGFGPELVTHWIAQTGGGDFALDAYVPQENHELIVRELRERGYLVVTLDWARVGSPPAPPERVAALARAYFAVLGGAEPSPAGAATPTPAARSKTVGCIDELRYSNGRLLIRGWAVDPSGQLPARLSVKIGPTRHLFDELDASERPDVRQHLDLYDDRVGFVLSIPVDPAELAHGIEVAHWQEPEARSTPLRLSAPAAEQLATICGKNAPA